MCNPNFTFPYFDKNSLYGFTDTQQKSTVSTKIAKRLANEDRMHIPKMNWSFDRNHYTAKYTDVMSN